MHIVNLQLHPRPAERGGSMGCPQTAGVLTAGRTCSLRALCLVSSPFFQVCCALVPLCVLLEARARALQPLASLVLITALERCLVAVSTGEAGGAGRC